MFTTVLPSSPTSTWLDTYPGGCRQLVSTPWRRFRGSLLQRVVCSCRPGAGFTDWLRRGRLSGQHVRMEEAIPILHVADADKAVAWYERLGYEKEWEQRFEPSLPAFVSIARHGTSRLFLSEHDDDAGLPLAAVTTVYIRLRDIDAIAREFDVEVVEQSWGAREMCLTDVDGNRLRIGTSIT